MKLTQMIFCFFFTIFCVECGQFSPPPECDKTESGFKKDTPYDGDELCCKRICAGVSDHKPETERIDGEVVQYFSDFKNDEVHLGCVVDGKYCGTYRRQKDQKGGEAYPPDAFHPAKGTMNAFSSFALILVIQMCLFVLF